MLHSFVKQNSLAMYLANENNAIHERAVCKAFAKIETLTLKIGRDEHDLIFGYYGGDITLEQFMLEVEGNKTELKVWQYIAESIEKSNKTQ